MVVFYSDTQSPSINSIGSILYFRRINTFEYLQLVINQFNYDLSHRKQICCLREYLVGTECTVVPFGLMHLAAEYTQLIQQMSQRHLEI